MSYHVRDVLESVQQAAPAPHTTTDDIIARARGMRTRRTAAVAAGGAAALVAIAVGAVTVLGAGPAEVPSAAEPVPASSLTAPELFGTVLGEYRTGAYRIGPVVTVTAGYQRLPVYRDGQTTVDDQGRSYPLSDGEITVYRPGVFSPDRLGADEPTDWVFGAPAQVTVAGHPGIARRVSQAPAASYPSAPSGAGPSYPAGAYPSAPAGERQDRADGLVRTALAWEYAPGAWATYVPQFLVRSESTAQAVAVAAAVTPKPVRPVRTPYRLDYLPEGWQTASVTENTTPVGPVLSEVFLHDGPIPRGDLATRVDLRLPSVHVLVMRGEPKDGAIRGKNGVHCYAPFRAEDGRTVGPACTVVHDGYLIDVDGRSTGLSAPVLRKIVDGLHPVELGDAAAWVPVER